MNFNDASCSLMTRFYDDVVHLTRYLKIYQPSQNLAAMLLRSSLEHMIGISFLELVDLTEEAD